MLTNKSVIVLLVAALGAISACGEGQQFDVAGTGPGQVAPASPELTSPAGSLPQQVSSSAVPAAQTSCLQGDDTRPLTQRGDQDSVALLADAIAQQIPNFGRTDLVVRMARVEGSALRDAIAKLAQTEAVPVLKLDADFKGSADLAIAETVSGDGFPSKVADSVVYYRQLVVFSVDGGGAGVYFVNDAQAVGVLVGGEAVQICVGSN